MLRTDVASRAGPTGSAWRDPRVVDAAALAAFLTQRGEPLKLSETDIELNAAGLVLHHQGRQIVWGKPPGREGGAEAGAGIKWERLAAFLADKQLSAVRFCDLRPLQAPTTRGEYALAHP